MGRVVGGFRSGDQQLGRHAAHAGAGRAVRAAFDQQRALARRFRGAISRQAGSAGADDGDISVQSFHDWVSPMLRVARIQRRVPPCCASSGRTASGDANEGPRKECGKGA
ncbi:hypothetical protein G6F65_014724 [Rhizopus arrhizus]|nr:hypothetical protein G6F65_014724 [Rhizopus arrhizus]